MAQHRIHQKRPTDDVRGTLPAQRSTIDGRALRAAAEAQAAADAVHPVAVQASLRDLVIAFEPMIEARKVAKWTDAEICAWLSQLGYEISRDTLRTYRSQLGIGVNACAQSPMSSGVNTEPIMKELRSTTYDNGPPKRALEEQTAAKAVPSMPPVAAAALQGSVTDKPGTRRAIMAHDFDEGV